MKIVGYIILAIVLWHTMPLIIGFLAATLGVY